MCQHTEHPETVAIRARQHAELVAQYATDEPLWRGTVTCPCGFRRAVTKAYRCLYCEVFFCPICAPVHFGQSVADYRAARAAEEASAGSST